VHQMTQWFALNSRDDVAGSWVGAPEVRHWCTSSVESTIGEVVKFREVTR
jgi:hypothetical protein